MGKRLDIWLGILFLIVGLAGVIIHLQQNAAVHLLWLSNHWAILNGLGFLTRSSFVFSSIVVLGIIPELIWVMDFSVMLTGQQLFGATSYMFAPHYPTPLWILAFQHFINPFASAFGIWRFGFHKKSWIGSAVHGILIWLVSILFIDSSYNINCAWKNCIAGLSIPDNVWRIVLPAAIFIHIALLSFVLQKWQRKTRRLN